MAVTVSSGGGSGGERRQRGLGRTLRRLVEVTGIQVESLAGAEPAEPSVGPSPNGGAR